MYRFAFLVIVVGCGKDDPKAVAPKPEPPPVADVKGVLVTASDVLVNGKSLGVLPSRLVTDSAMLVGAIAELRMTHPDGALALTYTDDASAEVVLGAVRAFDEAGVPRAAPKPEAADPGGTGTAMALDEGKLGEDPQLARARAIDEARVNGNLGSATARGSAYSISVIASGKPQKVCDARAIGAPGNDERVDLAVKLGAAKWQVVLTRVDEIETPASIAMVAEKIKAHKQSAFFADRTDIELVAEPGARGADLTPVLAAACAVGFFEIRPVAPAELAARLAADEEARRHVEPLTIGQPNVQGALDKAIVRRVVKGSRAELTACYQHELVAKPALRGTVSAQFAIAATGAVAASEASGVDPAVASCIAGVIKRLAFDKPADGSVVQVIYPFTFTPPAAPAATP